MEDLANKVAKLERVWFRVKVFGSAGALILLVLFGISAKTLYDKAKENAEYYGAKAGEDAGKKSGGEAGAAAGKQAGNESGQKAGREEGEIVGKKEGKAAAAEAARKTVELTLGPEVVQQFEKDRTRGKIAAENVEAELKKAEKARHEVEQIRKELTQYQPPVFEDGSFDSRKELESKKKESNLSKSGAGQTFTQHIEFKQSFSTPPMVFVSISYVDAHQGGAGDIRFLAEPTKITTKGFTLLYGSAWGSSISEIRVTWIAIGKK